MRMMRRGWVLLLELLGGLLAGAALVTGFLAWRLTHEGPIHLNFLIPYVEEAVNSPDRPYRIGIEDMILTWAGWQNVLDMRAVNVHLYDATGQGLATVPQLSMSFSGKALLHGLLAPTVVDIYGPSLVLVRQTDGAITFGRAIAEGEENATPPGQTGLPAADTGDLSGATDETAAAIAAIVGTLSQEPDPGAVTGYLRAVRILGGRIFLIDKIAGETWHVDQTRLDFRREGRLLLGTVSGLLPQFGEAAQITGSLSYKPEEQQLDLGVHVDDAALATFGRILPVLSPIAAARQTVSANLEISFDRTGHSGPGRFSISGGAGEIDLGTLTKKPLPVSNLDVAGIIDRAHDLLTITRASLDLGRPALLLTGTLRGIFSGKGEDGGAPQLDAALAVTNFPAASMDDYWPAGAAEDARGWLVPNIPAGQVDLMTARLAMRLPQEPGGVFRLERLNGTMRTSGLTVHYLQPLPPITDGQANATFDSKTFAADIIGGRVGDIAIKSGNLLITGLDQKDQFIKVGGEAAAPVMAALSLLDHPRLGYASKLGLVPSAASGDATARLLFDFPAEKNLTFDHVKIGVEATLSNLGLRQVFLGRDVSEGELALTLDEKGMKIKGPLKLAGAPLDMEWEENFTTKADFQQRIHVTGQLSAENQVALGYDYRPYINGLVGGDMAYTRYDNKNAEIKANFDLGLAELNLPFLKWQKPIDVPAQARLSARLVGGQIMDIPDFSVNGEALSIAGSALFGPDGKLERVAIPAARAGKTRVHDITAKLTGDMADVVIGGGEVDIEPLLSRDKRPQASEASPAIDAAEEDKPQRPFRLFAEKLDRIWTGDDRYLADARVEMRHDPYWWDMIAFDAVLPSGVPLVFDYRSDGQSAHRLSAETKDGGEALRVLDIFDSIKGGTLKITGTAKDGEPGRPLEGKLDMSSFRLTNTPFAARFLTVASLTGLVDVLTGEGFLFNGASARFTKTRGLIGVKEFRSAGPSIGLTAEGNLDLDRNTINLEGTLVPAYAINSLIGNIPILGNIIQGGAGEGLFALRYNMTGQLSEPKIAVNPLSVLAPGFLRDLFSPGAAQPQGTPPDTDGSTGGVDSPKPQR